MKIPDWRTFPALHGVFRGTQADWEYMWTYAEGAGVPPLFMAAILPQEGTGSFNTSSENPAADGGNGPEPDWVKDVQRATALVAGKLALWPQAVEQGFKSWATTITSPGDGAGYPCDGNPIEYVNWQSAILRTSGNVELGCYALHGSWHVGVKQAYLAMGGQMDHLEWAAHELALKAPSVTMRMESVRYNAGLASNWNGTTPEPAIVVTAAWITAPAPETCPVVCLDGSRKLAQRRGDSTWVSICGQAVPVRAAYEDAGLSVRWVGKSKGGPRVELLAPN